MCSHYSTRAYQVPLLVLFAVPSCLALVNVHVLFVELLCRIITSATTGIHRLRGDPSQWPEVVGVVDLAFCCQQACQQITVLMQLKGAK